MVPSSISSRQKAAASRRWRSGSALPCMTNSCSPAAKSRALQRGLINSALGLGDALQIGERRFDTRLRVRLHAIEDVVTQGAELLDHPENPPGLLNLGALLDRPKAVA